MKTVTKAALAMVTLLAPVAAAHAQDKGITLDHYLASAKKKMLKLDADKDGRVSSAEFAAGSPDAVKAGKRFKRVDANQDGFVDDAEIMAQATARFKKMDKNGDGMLTTDERKGGHAKPAVAQ